MVHDNAAWCTTMLHGARQCCMDPLLIQLEPASTAEAAHCCLVYGPRSPPLGRRPCSCCSWPSQPCQHPQRSIPCSQAPRTPTLPQRSSPSWTLPTPSHPQPPQLQPSRT
jgi:hypothetical protein